MLVAWWVLGLPRGSNTDKALVTAPDTLRGARLLFATFVFYRGRGHLFRRLRIECSSLWFGVYMHTFANVLKPCAKFVFTSLL